MTITVPPGSSINEPPSSLQPATQPALIIPPGPPIDSLERVSRHSFSLSMLPAVGECLTLKDMRVIALLPVEKSSQEIVHQQLETLRNKTGITPAGMLSDGGSDLTGGIAKFCAAHPETLGFGDLPHQAALLLKKRLKDYERWCVSSERKYSSMVGIL